jgi:hypothetical protein
MICQKANCLRGAFETLDWNYCSEVCSEVCSERVKIHTEAALIWHALCIQLTLAFEPRHRRIVDKLFA